MPNRVKEHVFALDARWCDELEEVLFSDPVPNLYSIEHYLACPLPVRVPRIPLHYYQGFVGCERDGQLCCVLLLGSNVVPVRLCGAAVEHIGHDADSHGAEVPDAPPWTLPPWTRRRLRIVTRWLSYCYRWVLAWNPCSVRAPS